MEITPSWSEVRHFCILLFIYLFILCILLSSVVVIYFFMICSFQMLKKISILFPSVIWWPPSWFSSVQLLSRVWLFVTPWTAPHQASLSISNSRSLLKLMSIELMMPFNHLILCRLLPRMWENVVKKNKISMQRNSMKRHGKKDWAMMDFLILVIQQSPIHLLFLWIFYYGKICIYAVYMSEFISFLRLSNISLHEHSIFLCIHLSFDGHLGCFHLLVIVSNAVRIMHVCGLFFFFYIFGVFLVQFLFCLKN